MIIVFKKTYPAGIYCSKLTIETIEQVVTSFFIVKFVHISHLIF